MFKPADPTRRIPTWLQNGTKENVIWQFKMMALVVAGAFVKDWYDQRQEEKNLAPKK